jgi:hypothetical protein
MCNRSAKYWETVTLDVPASQMVGPNNGFFKNSGAPGSQRTYSPGFLTLIIISPPNNDTPIELELMWDVSLRAPTFQPTVVEEPTAVNELPLTMVSSYDSDLPFENSVVTWDKQSNAYRYLKTTDFTPTLRRGAFYNVPGNPLVVANSTLAGVSISYASYVATDPDDPEDRMDFLYYWTSAGQDGKPIRTNLSYRPQPNGTFVVQEGTPFTPASDLGF